MRTWKSEQVEALIFRLCCPGGVSGQGLTSIWHLDSSSFYLGAAEHKLQPDQRVVRNCAQPPTQDYHEGEFQEGCQILPISEFELFENIWKYL